MKKYSKKSQDMVESAMHRMKKGTLKSSSGDKVSNPKQAIAIGLSEAREKGAKVPEKSESEDDSKSPAPKKKTTRSKTAKSSTASRSPRKATTKSKAAKTTSKTKTKATGKSKKK